MADDSWSLAEAKAKFSEVVERARTEGPQHVSRNGKDAVVVVSVEDWAHKVRGDKTVFEALYTPSIRGLLSNEEVEQLFGRSKDAGRPVDL
jgi:prevent-host-death family protein